MSMSVMTTVSSSDGYIQQDNMPCRKAQIISKWFLEHITVLEWLPQSPDLSPIERLLSVTDWKICIVDVQLTNLQQMHDAIMSILTKISRVLFPAPY